MTRSTTLRRGTSGGSSVVQRLPVFPPGERVNLWLSCLHTSTVHRYIVRNKTRIQSLYRASPGRSVIPTSFPCVLRRPSNVLKYRQCHAAWCLFGYSDSPKPPRHGCCGGRPSRHAVFGTKHCPGPVAPRRSFTCRTAYLPGAGLAGFFELNSGCCAKPPRAAAHQTPHHVNSAISGIQKLPLDCWACA